MQKISLLLVCLFSYNTYSVHPMNPQAEVAAQIPKPDLTIAKKPQSSCATTTSDPLSPKSSPASKVVTLKVTPNGRKTALVRTTYGNLPRGTGKGPRRLLLAGDTTQPTGYRNKDIIFTPEAEHKLRNCPDSVLWLDWRVEANEASALSATVRKDRANRTRHRDAAPTNDELHHAYNYSLLVNALKRGSAFIDDKTKNIAVHCNTETIYTGKDMPTGLYRGPIIIVFGGRDGRIFHVCQHRDSSRDMRNLRKIQAEGYIDKEGKLCLRELRKDRVSQATKTLLMRALEQADLRPTDDEEEEASITILKARVKKTKFKKK